MEHGILEFIAESECLAKVDSILAVAYLHVVQVQVATHYIMEAKSFPVVIELPVVGLLAGATKSEAVLARTQVQSSLDTHINRVGSVLKRAL